jgi:hypothetical protein
MTSLTDSGHLQAIFFTQIFLVLSKACWFFKPSFSLARFHISYSLCEKGTSLPKKQGLVYQETICPLHSGSFVSPRKGSVPPQKQLKRENVLSGFRRVLFEIQIW